MSSHAAGRVRLGLLAGAFFVGVSVTAQADAQVVPPPGSEVPIPPKPKTDSAAPKPDTIKPRFARSTDPHTSDVGPQYSWNREQLFGSGALNLAELLERLPGTTSFRTGWMNSQKFVAVNGDLDVVRVFYDGLELDNMNARTAPLLDLNTIQLWTLESVAVERLGGELRVYLRSWQPERTTPQTRVDVMTGDEDTNIYRGFYGKRFSNSSALQFAGQQFSTTSARFGGGGDGLSVLARVGIARRSWSVDAFANRTQSSRVIQPTFGAGLAIPPYEAVQTLAYVRAAVGQIRDGPWLEAIASNRRLSETSKHNPDPTSLHLIADTVDTARTQQQYLLSAGFTRGPLEISGSERMRASSGETFHSQSARAQFNSRYALVALSAEHDGFFQRNRADAVARISPTPFFSATAALSRTSSTGSGDRESPDVLLARFEGGVRLFGPWLIAGFMTRDTALLRPLRAIDTAYVPVFSGRRSGSYVGLRGTIIGALGADVVATQWASADAYRPKYQVRSEINVISNWLSRFPSGNFGIHAAIRHEYRGEVNFPVNAGVRTTASYTVFNGLLEIRILRAVVSYQIRNMAGLLYQVVPDFYMPRVINLYGVRWEFVN
jgi:hypothetical protein